MLLNFHLSTVRKLRMDKFQKRENQRLRRMVRLNRTFCKKDRNAVDDRIATTAATAEDRQLLKLQGRVTYGADERMQVLLREGSDRWGEAWRHRLNSSG
jgi:hypothetical protein